MGGNASAFLEKTRPENRLIIVRNPWSRIVSAYQDKIIRKKWDLKAACYGWKKYAEVKNATFEQFVDCLLQKPENIHYESHTHPMTALCGVCKMDYNIIIKLEDLAEATSYLMHVLKFNKQPDYVPPQKVAKTNTYSGYYKDIPAAQIEKLKETYHYDITLFNYPPDPFS